MFTLHHAGEAHPIEPLLDAAGLDRLVAGHSSILIKPNLVEALAPPITTPVYLVEQVIRYLQQRTDATLVVGEGTAAAEYDTLHTFEVLGYTRMAEALNITLVDLNIEPSVRLHNHRCQRWPEMYLPRLAMDSFLLSVPVLKAHSLAQVTLTMKNMMGLAPPAHYQQGGGWKKSAFHLAIQEAVADLNHYRSPDFTLLDATVGMAKAHLWGPTCDPPPQVLAASDDPVAIDAYGAALLGKKWEDIDHIRHVHRVLGLAEPLTVHSVEAPS